MAGASVAVRRGFFSVGRFRSRHVVLVASLALAAVASPFKLGVVTGYSMSPSLANRSLYMMDRTYFRSQPVKRDEIVVFRQDGGSYIKRVVGVPGDTIYTIRHKDSYQEEMVMDWQLERIRRAVSRPPWNRGMELIETQLGPDQYYVVGDNLAESVDSRTFGPISISSIQGRMLFAPPARPEMQHLARNTGKRRRS